MLTKYRTEIAKLIHKNAHDYEGFVDTNGTDTMVDSAAAFNYMLIGLNKALVLIGS